MKPARLTFLFPVALVSLLLAGIASAQTFPVVAGTMEVQVGAAGIVLPENTNGMVSAQPELRLGYFVSEGLQLQIVGDARVWPLGMVAPANYGVGAQFLWFPNLGPQNRNLYLLAGAGGAYSDPPRDDSQFDPLARVGLGVKVPLAGVGLGFLQRAHLTVEYRGELLFQDETDFVSGAAVGFSFFL
jgi:hypothetical protein